MEQTAAQGGTVVAAPDPDGAFVAGLWMEHGDALLGYVTHLVGDPGHAEDIVQEVMLRAWRRADRLDTGSRSLRPWLFTVAGHLVTDQQRARRRRPEVVDTDALEGRSSRDDTERAVDAWTVADALRSLSSEHRSVLVETYLRGRSVAETATVLGIPAGTVKSRAYYGLRALRVALEERGWS